MGHKLFSRYFKLIPAQVFLAKNINWVTKSLRLHSDASRSTTIGFNPQYHHQNHQGLAFRRLPYHSQEVHCTLYHLPDVLEFVVKKRVGIELTYEKTRLTAAMATKTELETKRLQQELLQTNLVNITWGMFLSDLEGKVRAIPEQVPEQLLQQETMLDCKTMLKELFSEALADLSRMEAMAKWVGPPGQICCGYFWSRSKSLS